MGNDNACPSPIGPTFTRKQAAELLGMSLGNLGNLATWNKGPAFTRSHARGNPAVYSTDDLRSWMVANRPAEVADFESRLSAMIAEG